MGSHQACTILDTLLLTAEQRASYAVVKACFAQHFVHSINEVYESVKFRLRVQETGEPVDTFYTALCKLVKTCGYPSPVETRFVRDQFAVGLHDRALVDKPCQSPKLTLEEARLQARIHKYAESAHG